ncbi:MAG: hypothetical protein A2092_19630 [Rhodobacteraceae bacterium GWE1_64_9]|nr:MAG: hypothetical protein A2092_19630 [Rhodobacteraceae bacterium GWE1_64_9]OHC47797.1 MAG: hypothetical protein A2X69_07195 [Rhodobacteraceae bacterium GWF1_65_7]
MARTKRIDSEQAEGWWAIKKDEVQRLSVKFALTQSIMQQEASLFVGDQFDICRRQVSICRANQKVRYQRRLNGVCYRYILKQHIIACKGTVCRI